MNDVTLAGWTRGQFAHGAFARDTYQKGQGPGVLIIHEIPGITPNVVRFADDVISAGFTVLLPDLIGTPGRAVSAGYLAKSFLSVCIAKEFTTWSLGKTSPIIEYLRALGRDLHARVGGHGIGVLGMCFSGGFALGLMVEPHVVAPVLSQPSLPFPVSKRLAADLNLSAPDLEKVQCRAQQGCQVLGLRYKEDRAVGTRFDTLRQLLGDAFLAVELPSRSLTDHSVLTEQRNEAAVERVIEFLRDKLGPEQQGPSA